MHRSAVFSVFSTRTHPQLSHPLFLFFFPSQIHTRFVADLGQKKAVQASPRLCSETLSTRHRCFCSLGMEPSRPKPLREAHAIDATPAVTSSVPAGPGLSTEAPATLSAQRAAPAACAAHNEPRAPRLQTSQQEVSMASYSRTAQTDPQHTRVQRSAHPEPQHSASGKEASARALFQQARAETLRAAPPPPSYGPASWSVCPPDLIPSFGQDPLSPALDPAQNPELPDETT